MTHLLNILFPKSARKASREIRIDKEKLVRVLNKVLSNMEKRP